MKIDRSEISKELAHIYEREACYDTVHRFGPGSRAFDSSSSEETIWFLRGRVSSFNNLSHFWIQSLHLTQETDLAAVEESATVARFKSINTEIALKEIESRSSPVIKSFNLSPEQDLREAYIMRNEWNDLIIIAEGSHNFIYFGWDTKA